MPAQNSPSEDSTAGEGIRATDANPSNLTRRRFLKLAGAAVATAVAVGAIGSYYEFAYLPSLEPLGVTLGIPSTGPGALVYQAATSQKYFDKNKLNPAASVFSDLSTENSSFIANKVAFIWNGNLAALSNARAQGSNVQVIYGNLVATNRIIVRNNSPYESIYDLKGKTVGVPVLPSLSFIVAAEAWNTNNPTQTIDPLKDFTYSKSPSALLNQELFSGQI